MKWSIGLDPVNKLFVERERSSLVVSVWFRDISFFSPVSLRSRYYFIVDSRSSIHLFHGLIVKCYLSLFGIVVQKAVFLFHLNFYLYPEHSYLCWILDKLMDYNKCIILDIDFHLTFLVYHFANQILLIFTGRWSSWGVDFFFFF